MHTRRGQKTTETSFINMVKLQRDLKRCKDLLEMVKKREVQKKELLVQQIAVIKQRFELKDWNGTILHKILPKPVPKPAPLQLITQGIQSWNSGGSPAEVEASGNKCFARKSACWMMVLERALAMGVMCFLCFSFSSSTPSLSLICADVRQF